MTCELEKYPYFIYPAAAALRENRLPGSDVTLSDEDVTHLRRLIAANVGDIPSLRLILGIDPEEFSGFYPDMLPPSLSTADTIDSFLSRFGDATAPTPRAAAEIPVETATYSIEEDTAGMEETLVGDATASAIDSFLSGIPSTPTPDTKPTPQKTQPANPESKPAPQKTQPANPDCGANEVSVPIECTSGGQKPQPGSHQSEISEPNARILIKNHDYQAALEIIQQLSLNNPEKSIYFADQIRFLRKLILNQVQKNN